MADITNMNLKMTAYLLAKSHGYHMIRTATLIRQAGLITVFRLRQSSTQHQMETWKRFAMVITRALMAQIHLCDIVPQAIISSLNTLDQLQHLAQTHHLQELACI